jgi:DNA-binding HxlR family transcriptional regulator
LLSGNEGIASNILASRLKRLESAGMITRRRDPAEPKRVIYQATEMGLDLLPVMIELMRWSMKHDPKTGAPAQFVRRIAEDRDGLIADIRAANKPHSRKGAVSRAAGRT